jgi:hypothetical protein
MIRHQYIGNQFGWPFLFQFIAYLEELLRDILIGEGWGFDLLDFRLQNEERQVSFGWTTSEPRLKFVVR